MTSMAVTNKPAKSAPRKDQKNDPKGNNAPFNLGEYLKGVKSEWPKISWPTWPHIWGQIIVVVVMVTVMTLGLFAIDNILRFTIAFITGQQA